METRLVAAAYGGCFVYVLAGAYGSVLKINLQNRKIAGLQIGDKRKIIIFRSYPNSRDEALFKQIGFWEARKAYAKFPLIKVEALAREAANTRWKPFQ